MLRKRYRLAFVLLAVLAMGCDGKLVSRGEETQLGHEAARVIERQSPVSKDPQLQSLVERIGRQIAANSSRPDINFVFRVLDEKEINALSVPGYVYVNRGLITATNANPDELAAVIAHEIAHTTERHMAKRLERIYGASFLLQALASGKAAVDTLAQVAAELALAGNSRQEERESDAQALRFMTRAGYDPQAMPRFFERLRKATGDAQGLNKYFSTHPSNTERIARAQQQITAESLVPVSTAPRPGTR